MPTKLLFICLGIALTLPLTGNAAPNLERGEELLLQSCYGCHGEDVYVRANRMVMNYTSLKKRVDLCTQQVNAMWFEDEVRDTVEFLNTGYYHFKN